MLITWAGKSWKINPLPASAALHVARVSDSHPEAVSEAVEELLYAAGLDIAEVVLSLVEARGADSLQALIALVLSAGTVRPPEASVALARVAVTRWSTVRARLILAGIPDPLRALPSLTALLDFVEHLILEGISEEQDREQYMREMYRGSALDAPPGWEDGAELNGIL